MSGATRTRAIVYGLVLLLIAGTFAAIELYAVPNKVERLVRQLGHPNARVASDAWHELGQLYYTKWAAVGPLLAHADSDEPIFFLIEAEPVPVPGKPDRRGFRSHGRAWFHRAEERYGRSVGDAICSLLYNERKESGNPMWKHDYQGDWKAWWSANQGYYGI